MEIFNIQKKQHDEVFKWIEREKTNDFDVLLNTFIQFQLKLKENKEKSKQLCKQLMDIFQIPKEKYEKILSWIKTQEHLEI